MKPEFIIENPNNYQNHIFREWLLTNGLGGYGGGTVIGANCRLHQGYLIASLNPPVDRYLVFSKTNERLVSGSRIYDLTTGQHKVGERTDIRQGNVHQKSFKYDGKVEFVYEAGGLTLTKTIALTPGVNQCLISYELTSSGQEAGLVITPLVDFKEHSSLQTIEGLDKEIPFDSIHEIEDDKNKNTGFYYSPLSRPDVRVTFQFCGGSMQHRSNIYDENMELPFEVMNEADGLDSHLKPFDFVMEVAPHQVAKASLICTVETKKPRKKNFSDIKPITALTAFEGIDQVGKRVDTLLEKAGCGQDEFLAALTLAADQFIVKRNSTGLTTVIAGYPWFTDWGRDTMIAFTGIALETGRFDEAKEILLSFAKYIKNGLVPNMFPDDGKEPLYNTVDASLWYFYAVYNYLKYQDSKEAWTFVEKEIYPALMQIMGAYRKGTDFSIGMDDDALLFAGSDLDQVTWMDVRVGDWVATPRHGKPVEINALWYNALMTMEYISRGIAKRTHNKPENYLAYAGGCATLAAWTRESFREQFWYQDGAYLYDVVDKDDKDATLRPNQLYAVSLPFTMLDPAQEAAVVKAVAEKLYVGVGLRTLPSYHPDYHGIYQGSLEKRDQAYHQGTAWAFLLGPFIESYLKVFDYSPKAREDVKGFFEPIKEHLLKNCIGSISEIFDGDKPHEARGCFAQAWSVGEILRAYKLYLGCEKE